jgi:DNA-binding NarL/FixJ family response regulator/class 3 adenylate cyclase
VRLRWRRNGRSPTAASAATLGAAEPRLAGVTSLPTGNVTFFIADVESSTSLQQDVRVDYPAVIGAVRSILRSAITANDGHEVDAVGDELLAAFCEASDAAAAALATQRAMRDADWPEGVRVRLRIGIHSGAPDYGDEGYTGLDIVRAARISHAGHGGQILASAATLDGIAALPSADLGEHAIEGLSEPERIHQLVADDLPRDFPPLRNTSSTVGHAIRVVIADDSVLLREGIVRLLSEVGFDVVAQSGTADDLLRHVGMHKPHVAVVDIRMPPTYTDEGLRAAAEIRERFPDTGVLVLSQYVEAGYAMDLLSDSAEGVGYLLKDRVSDVEQFAASVRRVAEGGSVLDPDVVSQLIGRRRRDDPLDQLTPREREVLELMAEGRSNQAIADRLFVTLRAVEKHVTSIFTKLDLPASTEDHRRVLAVLAAIRA